MSLEGGQSRLIIPFMPIEIVAALLAIAGLIGVAAFIRIMSQRAAAKAARGSAYPDFELAMRTYLNLALNEPRQARAMEANEAVSRLVVKLRGVASRKTLVLAESWFDAVRTVQAAQAIHQEATDSGVTKLAETWAQLQEAVGDEERARIAFRRASRSEVV